jgi:hypothetical protein
MPPDLAFELLHLPGKPAGVGQQAGRLLSFSIYLSPQRGREAEERRPNQG